MHSQAILRVVDPAEGTRHRGRVHRGRGERGRLRRRRRRAARSARSATTTSVRPTTHPTGRPRHRLGHQAQGLTARPFRAPRKLTPRGDFHPCPACLARADRSSDHHRRAVRHQRARRVRVQGELVEPGARARPPGRHADHPRGADRRRRRAHERADEPGRHDHPPARRRLRCRRGRRDDRGRQEHRRPDPRSGRRADPPADRGIRAAAAARRARTRDSPRRPSSARTARRRRTRRPTRRWQATPTAEPTNGSDPAWITPALQAEFLAYDCANPDNDPANAPKDQPLITCEADGTRQVHPRTGRARRIVDQRRHLRPAADQRPVGGQPQVRRRRHQDVRRDQPAPVRRGPAAQPVRVRARRLRALRSVDERDHPRRRPEHHRQLHPGDAPRRSPTS